MTEQIDVEALIQRLWLHDDERLYREADVLMSEAADALTQLQAENAALKLDVATFKHGHRIASDNCARLETMLAEERARHNPPSE